MVLNHNQNNEDIDSPDSHFGYLVCTYCRGYYQLQEGESPDDFLSCECGSPMEYQSTLQFRSRINNPDSDKFGTTIVSSSYNEVVERKIEDHLNTGNNPLPDNIQIINRLPQQDNVSQETLINIQQDKRELWDIVDQYKNSNEHTHQTGEQDVIEINRFMMLVDQKRALEGNDNPSKWNSISHRIGPVGVLSVIIVLLITVLILNLAGDLI